MTTPRFDIQRRSDQFHTKLDWLDSRHGVQLRAAS